MRRTMDPQPSFADVVLRSASIAADTMLQRVSDFLDGQHHLVERVRNDLVRGLKRPQTGRQGMNAERVLRSFVLQRIKNWDFRELRERIAEGYTTRLFTQFGSARVPGHDAFNRAFNRLTPETLHCLNDAVIQAAVDLGLEDGKKLRVDSTVVETDVHFPTDCTLLWDAVRVMTRLLQSLQAEVPAGTIAFTLRTRSARRRMQEIQRMTPKQRHDHQVAKYRELIRTTEQVVRDARVSVERAKQARLSDMMKVIRVEALSAEIERYCGLADRVIDQARRRVLQGEQVPNNQKLFSIFETHTDLIIRGKAQKPVEFGHKVFLAESASGLITQYSVLNGNPSDEGHVVQSLKTHMKVFGAAPQLYASDRGFHSPANLAGCKKAKVALECIPQRGGRRTPERLAHEKSPAFRQGQRFRAGIEGRISVLLRRGMRRCLFKGRRRFETFVGVAVLVNNLMILVDRLARRSARRARAS
jgi:IS5 family transposase